MQAAILTVYTTLQWSIAVFSSEDTQWGNHHSTISFQVSLIKTLWETKGEGLPVGAHRCRQTCGNSTSATSGNNKAIQSCLSNYQQHEAIINFLTTADETNASSREDLWLVIKTLEKKKHCLRLGYTQWLFHDNLRGWFDQDKQWAIKKKPEEQHWHNDGKSKPKSSLMWLLWEQSVKAI